MERHANAGAPRPGRGALWLVTLGRVLAAFGLGVLAMRNFPGVAGPLGVPAASVGIVLLFVAGRRLARGADGAPEHR